MHRFTRTGSVIAGIGLALGLYTSAMADPITITPLYSGTATDLGGKQMTVVELVLEPGAAMPPHRHPGTVYAYVVSGTITSKLSTDAEEIIYNAGQGWVELPGVIHEVFKNPAASGNATLTATLIHNKGEELTTLVK